MSQNSLSTQWSNWTHHSPASLGGPILNIEDFLKICFPTSPNFLRLGLSRNDYTPMLLCLIDCNVTHWLCFGSQIATDVVFNIMFKTEVLYSSMRLHVSIKIYERISTTTSMHTINSNWTLRVLLMFVFSQLRQGTNVSVWLLKSVPT